ncbi:uncharacterized protein TNCV_888371 [Trichonephila clavipes]|nr:uncharacterized protein TNCV_888371 [Trichonephila clavipes]
MNELLGWYGYEKVDSRDTQGLNLTHFASNNSSATGNTNNPSSNGVSPPSSAIEGSDGSEDATSHNEGLDDPSRLRSDSISPGQDEILNEEHQETQRNVSPSEQEEDERGPKSTSAVKDLLKKWADVRAMVLEWHPNQADVSRVGDLYNNNAINYIWKILKKREKQSTLDMFFNAP